MSQYSNIAGNNVTDTGTEYNSRAKIKSHEKSSHDSGEPSKATQADKYEDKDIALKQNNLVIVEKKPTHKMAMKYMCPLHLMQAHESNNLTSHLDLLKEYVEINLIPNGGFEDGTGPSGRICLLIKSLYGLKLAGRAWNFELDAKLMKHGFTRLLTYSCVHTKQTGNKISIITVSVDDLLIFATTNTTAVAPKSRWTHQGDDPKALWPRSMSMNIETVGENRTEIIAHPSRTIRHDGTVRSHARETRTGDTGKRNTA